MPEPTTAVALWAAYQSLPEATKAKVNKVAGKLIGLAAPTAWQKVRAWTFGARDQRVMKRSLKAALGTAVPQREGLDAIDVLDRLSRPPLADLIVEVVRQPTAPIDPKRVREVFEEAGYHLASLGVDEVMLVRTIQESLLVVLRTDDDPQGKLLHLGVRTEQIHDAVGEMKDSVGEILAAARASRFAVGSQVGPATEASPPDLLPQAMRALYRQGREAFVSGDLDTAETAFSAQLQVIRNGELAPGRPLSPEAKRSWELHAQDLLLSLAQVAVLRDRRGGAENYLREATSLGEYQGRARYFAGWVLANLNRMREAQMLLEVSDGTKEWDVLRAVVYLNLDAFEDFQRVCANESTIDDIDVLVSLVQYYLRRDDVESAARVTAHILREPLVSPGDWTRAAEAAVSVLRTYAASLAPPASFDPQFWISEIRNLFVGADAAEGSNPMMVQRSLAWHRFNLHRLLLEAGPEQAAFSQILRIDPAGAAYIVAHGFYTPSEEHQILTARDAAPNRVVRDTVEALRLLHFTEDRRAAMEAFEAVRPLAEGDLGDRVTSAAIELRAQLGESPDALLTRIESEIGEHVSGELLRVAVLQLGGREPEAIAEMERLLERAPADLTVLRSAYHRVIELAEAQSETDQSPGHWASRAVKVGRALVTRLPCPEHTVRLARALGANGELSEAYELIHALDTEGYQTRQSVGLLVELTRALNRFRECSDAADRYCREFDQSARARLRAAQAAARAREFELARRYLTGLLDTDGPSGSVDVAENAYRLLSHITLTETPNDPTALERSLRLLLDGYDRLGMSTSLAGTLFSRGLGSGLEDEIAGRLSRDFGALSNLPGFVPITADQLLAMQAAAERQLISYSTLYHAGLIAFETYAEAQGEVSAVWYERWELQVPTVISPPEPVSDSVLPSPAPTLLIERTALLTLVETDMLETVFESDLPLSVERATLEWLAREELSLSTQVRPAVLERGEELLRMVHVAPEVEILQSRENEGRGAVPSPPDPEEPEHVRVALENGWRTLDDDLPDSVVPEEHQGMVVRSQALLDSLLEAKAVRYSDAARASETAPTLFADELGTARVPLDLPIVLSLRAAFAWQEAGLLSAVTNVLPDVFITRGAWQDVSDELTALRAYRGALSALTRLRTVLEPAVEAGRLIVAPHRDEQEREAERRSEPHEPASALVEELDRDPAAAVARITKPIDRLYRAATDVQGALWADDAAPHLYLHSLGPFAVPTQQFFRRASELKAMYPGVAVFGTPEILRWLERSGRISGETRLTVLEKLALRGRLLIVDSELFRRLADQPASGSRQEDGVSRLSFVLHRAHAELPPEAVFRGTPAVVRALAEALVAVWYDQADENARAVIRSILFALQPWTSGVYAAYGSKAFWLLFSSQLIPFVAREPEVLVATVLDEADGMETELRESFLSAWTTFAEYAYRVEPERRPLIILLMDRAGSVATVRTAKRRSVLPDDLARIAMESLGVTTGGTSTYEIRTPEGRVSRVSVDVANAEEMVASRLAEANLAAQAAEREFSISPGRLFRTHVPGAVVDGAPEEKIEIEHVVEPLILLRIVEPGVQIALVNSMREYHRARSAYDVVSALDAFAEEVAAGSFTDVGRCELLHDLLNSPQWLLAYDVRLAFEALHAAGLDQLWGIAGATERWIAGEDLASRFLRIKDAGGQSSPFVTDFWGAFEPTVAALRSFCEENAAAVSADEFQSLVGVALGVNDPYRRIYSTFLAVGILDERPDLRRLQLTFAAEQSQDGPGWTGPAAEFLRFLILHRLTPPSPGHEAPSALSNTGSAGDFLMVMLQDEPDLFHLHELTYRLVHRAVWSPSHVQQVAAAANQRRADGEVAVDEVGDLLLLGQLVTARMYSSLPWNAREAKETASELTELLESFPFHQSPGDPHGDLTVPDALGATAPHADPYLTTSLALFEWISARSSSRPEIANSWWWSAELSARLTTLARRQRSRAAKHLEDLAAASQVSNRLGSLMGLSAETRAEQLLNRLPDRGASVESPWRPTMGEGSDP
jgi:hypothetical protein